MVISCHSSKIDSFITWQDHGNLRRNTQVTSTISLSPSIASPSPSNYIHPKMTTTTVRLEYLFDGIETIKKMAEGLTPVTGMTLYNLHKIISLYVLLSR